MRFRIIHKMLVGYAFSLAIAVCFGVYVYSQIGQIMAKQQLVEVADDAKEQLLELRRNEKNYIIRRDPIYLTKIHEIIGQFRGKLDHSKTTLAEAFGSGDYQRLLQSIELYSSLVEEFAQNYQTTGALTAELRKIGKELEQQVFNSKELPLIGAILQIRLLEEDFILLRTNESFLELKERILALNQEPTLTEENKSKAALYLSRLGELFEHDRHEDALLLRVRDSANTMEGIIARVAAQERTNIAGYVVSSQHLLLVALLALAFFGSLLSWFFSKIISAPLQKLEATVRQITKGDFELRLDAKGDAETFSLQNSINTMLDTLDLARESLATSVQLLQEKGAQLVESEKLASIGILASGVAHEINNPLANITLTADMLMLERKELPEDEIDELLTDILGQTARAASVVNNLLDYARSIKETRSAQEDLRQILQQSIKLVSHEMKLRDIDFRQRIPAQPLLVYGNRGKLEQVFVNVMLNAVQAMEKQGTLSVFADYDDQKRIVLQFSDTGPGISEENLHNIFDPFFTTKSAGKGTGLGLYISYGIIQEHGGTIQVTSKIGVGTTVTISLPLQG